LGCVGRAGGARVRSAGRAQAVLPGAGRRALPARDADIPVSRGTIFDRNGEPLAVSTPVMSIWAIRRKCSRTLIAFRSLAQALGMNPDDLKSYLEQRSDREFVICAAR
jgi:cell division protein FtsI/penicillin-binding protein 2